MACNETETTAINLFKFSFHLFVALPTVILDILLIYAVYFHKPQLHNPFYAIFSFYGVMQFLYFFVGYLYGGVISYFTFLRCPILDNYSDFSFTFTFFWFFPYYVLFGLAFGFMFMSINRLTAVIVPMYYKKLWNKILTPVLISCCILPFIFSFQTIAPTAFVSSSTGGVAMIYQRWIPLKISLTSTIVTCSVCVISTFCTILTLFVLIRMPHRVKSLERNLCIVGCTMSVTYAFNTVINICKVAFGSNVNDHRYAILRELSYFVSDLAFIPGPWSLLFMSAELKQRIIGYFGFKTTFVAPTTTMGKTSGNTTRA